MAGGGVERGEQLVGRIGTGFDQGIKQCGFARIGVSDERDVEGAAPVALFALRLALALDLVQLLFSALDVGGDHAPIQFDLGFTGTAAITDATALALQMRPAAHQTGTQILQARQFHL